MTFKEALNKNLITSAVAKLGIISTDSDRSINRDGVLQAILAENDRSISGGEVLHTWYSRCFRPN